jgi:hypothetical protein
MLNAPGSELVDAAEKMGPSEKDANNKGGVYARATSTTAARYEIPAEWLGRYVTLTVETVDCEIVFGDAFVACVYGQNSALTGEALASDDGTGTHYFFGQHYDFKVDPRHTHFSVDAGGTGRFTIALSSRQAP